MKYNHEVKHALKRDYLPGGCLAVTVEYNVARYYPARIGGRPEDCSPAEGGEVTDLRVTDSEGTEVVLEEGEEATIEEFIYEHHDY